MPKTYTSDREWIKDLLTYEQTSGSPRGGSHGNYGYNRTEAPKFKNIEEAVDYFVENDLPFIKEQYPSNITERAKAGDYIFNTGKDPKLYAVNQYLNDAETLVEQADLDYLNEKDPNTGDSKRVRIKNAMVDGVVGFKYGDPADSVKINELYDKYVRNLPDKERITNLDDARNFYYQNTNVGSGSFKATWEGRTNLYGGYEGKQTEGRKDATATELNKRMAEMKEKGTAEDPNQPYVKKDANGNLIENTPEEIQKAEAEAKNYVGKKGTTGGLTVINAEGFASANEQDAEDGIPEGKMVDDSGNIVDDPSYVPSADSSTVSPDAPAQDAPVTNITDPKFISSITNGDEKKKAFYERYYPTVSRIIEERGIPLDPSVAITQMGMESGWSDFSPTKTNKRGTASDTTQSSFGVKPWPKAFTKKEDGTWEVKKGKEKDGRKVIYAGTYEVIDGKKVYPKEPFVSTDSFEGMVDVYLDFLTENPRYKKALNKDLSAKEQLLEIAKAGYATEPAYQKTLTGQMERDAPVVEEIKTNLEKDKNFYNSAASTSPSKLYRGGENNIDVTAYSSTGGSAVEADNTFSGSVLNPSPMLGNDGKPMPTEKYVTEITDPSGKTQKIFTAEPLEEKTLLGEKYYESESGDIIYEFNESKDAGKYLIKDYRSKEKKDRVSQEGYKVGKSYTDRFSAKEALVNERAKELKEKSLKEGLTAEEYDQAVRANKLQNIYHDKRDKERAKQGFGRNKVIKDKEISNINKDFGNDVVYPELRKRVFDAEKRQEKILEGAEERLLSGEITEEEYDVVKTNYDKWEETHKKDIEQIKKWGGNQGGTLREEQRSKAKATNYEKGFGLVTKEAMAKANEMLNSEDYTHVNTAEEQAKIDAEEQAEADPTKATTAKNDDASSSKKTKTDTNKTDAEESSVNPEADKVDNGMLLEEAKTDPEIAAYLDEDYLLEQNKLDQETIDFIKGQKEFNAEIPEEEADYSNLLGNITDISKGLIGAAGAMEEVPEYETGAMYNQSVNDLTRMKDQGLSKQELDYATGNAEKAFEYGMAQYRGTNAASALVGAGQQAAILQDQYGKISAADRGVRRQNMQNFVQGAVRDEGINRTKFQDKFSQVMLNKQEGAALARDAYTNMNERAQFESQYGKDSQYAKLMNEQMLSLKENREAKKQSAANQKRSSIDKLQKAILERQAKIDKNKATG